MDSWHREIIITLCLFTKVVWCGRYLHLGCYSRVAPGTEIEGLRFNYDRLELGTCATGCNKEGYPYISLQMGRHCVCVSAYGRGGITFGTYCNYTCHTDRRFLCGGHVADSIYYAVDSEPFVVDRREEVTYSTALTFLNARKDCIRRGGDVITLRHIFQLLWLVTSLNQTGSASQYWIGVHRNSWDAHMKWTTPRIAALDVSASSVFWARDHPTPAHRCTLLDVTSGKWLTADCEAEHAYICHHSPVPPAAPPILLAPASSAESILDGAERESEFWASNKELMAYLVFPLFLLCYGGSCVAYAIHRSRRYCRKRKRAIRRAQGPSGVSIDDNRKFDPIPSTSAPGPAARAPKTAAKKAEVPEVPGDDSEIDFTKLPLADIAYIRAMLGLYTSKNKRRRILIT